MSTENITPETVWLPESKRGLSTTCYDGTLVSTPWRAGVRYFGPAQRAQADEHREAVRMHLSVHGLRRLPAVRA